LVAIAIFLVKPDVPELAANDFRAVQPGELQLQMRTVDGSRLERFFEERDIRFPTRVFDLTMMDYRVMGGRVHSIAGGPSALFVYEADTGALVVCQMYEGEVERLPGDAELRVHDQIPFYVFREGALTVVFWQEGDVTCVMTSDIDSEALIQLAFAKAIRV
jgi:anti-sigma factor RsiW